MSTAAPPTREAAPGVHVAAAGGATYGRMAGFIAARLGFASLVVVSSFYCLLAYIPFTHYAIVKDPVVAWLPVFTRWHPYLYLVVAAAVAATLRPALRQRTTRRITIWFLGALAVIAIALFVAPPVSRLPQEYISLIYAGLALFPLVWLGLIDMALSAAEQRWPPASPRILRVSGALLAATVVAGFYFLVAYGRNAAEALSPARLLLAFIASWTSHATLFLLVVSSIGLCRALATRFRNADKARFFLLGFFAWTFAAVAFRKVALKTLAFNDPSANLYSAAFGLAIVAAVSGTYLRACHPERARLGLARESKDLGERPAPPERSEGAKAPTRASLFAIAVLLAFAYFLPHLIAATDWDYLFQKLAIVAIWAGILACVARAPARARPLARSITAAVLILVFAWGLTAWGRIPGLKSRAAHLDGIFDFYSGYDVSFRAARDLLAPALNDGAYSGFYALLRRNTLIKDPVAAPAGFRLADLATTAGRKPNIFLIVVDSLRRDYLAPYNRRVDFTPAIAAFAGESIVFQNAFTHYAGTSLAEPSIWTGSLQLHKEYVAPFAAINSLQKLIEADGYKPYVTIDDVLHAILRPSPDMTRLDAAAKHWSEHDFARTEAELEAVLGAADFNRPVFVYTQPQNVHPLTLYRFGKQHPPRQPYPSFKRQYASEIERIDAAFGKFIAFLKARGVYDNSIVVLTSDHGDSFGQYGRLGHTDYLTPDILRIPLIIHLPPRMRAEFQCAPAQVAFSTDITPTLYYLLGHRPTANSGIFGRPLFTTTLEEQAAYRRATYLVASSYAPVWGILDDNGAALFAVDAQLQRNYYYRLTDDPAAIHNRATEEIVAKYHALIRDAIADLNRAYHFEPK